MKNSLFAIPSKFDFWLAFCSLFFAITAPPMAVKGQSIQCSLDVPTDVYQQLIAQKPIIDSFIEAFTQSRGVNGQLNIEQVPVRFTAIANDNGNPFASGSNSIPQFQPNVDYAISTLNQAFAPAGISFVQCGDINYIWDSRIRANEDIDKLLTSFAYTSGAIELYIKASGPTPFAPIPDLSFLQGNPNSVSAGNFVHTNFIKLNVPADLDKTMIHEMGHHFGLLHTHMMSTQDILPILAIPPSNANDNPYAVIDQVTQQTVPTWWGRELVIRGNVPVGTKPFPQINSGKAGDLLEDTPADCSHNDFYPGCPLTAQNPACGFDNTLTYKDYNNDAINPPPAGFSLGRNYMSYWLESCVNQFTPKQYSRIQAFYQLERKPKYTLDKCGNFTDAVEFQGGNKGLHNVTVRVRHAATNQECNVTTNPNGLFSGILHQDNLNTTIYHNGKKTTLDFPNDPLKVHYGHNRCDWIKGVNSSDIELINKHILGITPFTSGYSLIAADVNKSNTVTTFDIVELRKLILGVYPDYLPNFDQPWRYIPEFVPQSNPVSFNANPFGLLGGAYLEQGWNYNAPSIGQRGFDGIKIGDVNAGYFTETSQGCPLDFGDTGTNADLTPVLDVPVTPLFQDQTVTLKFKTKSALQLSSFQLGLKIPYAYFEVLDISTNTLPNYTKEEDFGLTHLDEDAVRTVWFDSNGGAQTLSSNSTLFSITVKAKQPIVNLQTLLKLDNDILPNLFFQSNAITASAVSLAVEVDTSTHERSEITGLNTDILEEDVLHCEPNPLQNTLRVTFIQKEQREQGILTISNIYGNTVYEQRVVLTPGENTLRVDALKDAQAGIYWIALYVSGKTHTQKIVKN